MITFLGVISAIICLGMVAAFAMWILTLLGVIKTSKRSQRGFEVKLNTGEPPVLQEREDDHG